MQLSIAGTTDSVTVIGFFYGYDPNSPYNPLQQVTFDDGTVWNLDTLVAKASVPGILAFSSATYSVNEDGTPITAITVTRTEGSYGAASVILTSTDGTANAVIDYTNTPITVNFADGEITKTVNIPIVNDNLIEGNETVNLTLTNPTNGATIGTQNTATLTIVDNDTSPGELISENLPIASYTASSSWTSEGALPDKAFDGSALTSWNSGNYASQWIEVDLGQEYHLYSIQLLIAQLPGGSTTHEVWVSNQSISNSYTGATLAKTFQGFTVSGDWLESDFSNSTKGRYVQVKTVESPSWIAWLEIQILGEPLISASSVLAFSQPTFSVNEDGTTIQQVTVSRTGGSSGAVAATINLTNGTATAVSDYNNTSITVTFADGEISKTVTIPIINDTQFESDETINLTLTNPQGGATLGNQTTATLTVINDDLPQPGLISLNNSIYTVNENGTASITLTRTGGSDGIVSVILTPSDGTATGGNDYDNSPTTVTFANGETSTTVTIPIIDDNVYEPTETVNLTLSNPTGGATLGTQQTAILNIVDNDAVPGTIQFSNADYSVNENGTLVTAVTLTRSNGSDGAVSVRINLTNGTATAPSDYNNTAITVNFANGETSKTVTIPIVNDSQFETDETINLSLSNPQGGATLGTQTTAVLTILESITPTVEIANSQTEFSGTQGQNNWYYGYYDGPFNSSDFQQMNQFSSSTWYLQNGTYWTQLWATGGHPNGQITSGGRLPVQQWAVRRWVSEIDGVVDISGSVLGGSTIGRIFVNGVELLSQNISGQTANYNLRVAVQKGTFVDFAIDPKDNNDLSDSTLFTAKIIGNVVPQHGVLNLSNAQFIVNEYGTASITLTRTNGSDGEVSVILTPSNGSAVAGDDYTNTLITVTFADGQTSKTVTIPIVSDNEFEFYETVNLTLTNPTGGATLGNQSTGKLIISPDFTLNGVAKQTLDINNTNPVLRLTDGLWQSGSAFLTNRISLENNASFSTAFQFQISNPQGIADNDGQGADGLVFVVQTVANNTGGRGGGIGYSGINPSLGIEFDTYKNGSIDDDSGNHVGININGNIDSVVLQPIPTRLNNGNIWTAWVDYNGVDSLLEVRLASTNQRPDNPLLSYSVDLISVLQTPNAYIGFTSGTGAASGYHDVLSWDFNTTYNPISSGKIAFSSPTYSFNENGNIVAAVTINRTGGSFGEVSVILTPSNGSAIAPSDYTNTPITVTFANGETSKTVTIPIVDDSIYEPTETVNLTLSNPTGGATLGTQQTAILTIIDNDAIPGVIQFSNGTYSINENGTPVTAVTLMRTNGSDGAVSVTINLTNGTATAPSDYNNTPITVNFANGETSKTVTIPIVNDTQFEPNETVNLTLSNPTGGVTLGTQTTAVLTIINDDLPQRGIINLNSSNYTVNENGTANITLTRTNGSDGEVSVILTPSNGSAIAGEDYTNTPITVTFANGETSKTVTIPINNDSIYEPTETVNLTLSNPTGGATLGTQQTAILTIIDNDAVPGVIQFSNGTYSINENGTPVTAVTLTRTNGSDGAVSIIVNLTNGTATAGSDYNNTPITVNFANGETSKTVTIPIIDDSIFEATETLNLSLSNPTNGVTIGSQNSAIVNIIDNDFKPTLTVTISGEQVTEGNTIQGTVTRNTDTTDPLTVTLVSSDNTQLTVPTTITIPAGSNSVNFNLNAVDDTLIELAKNYTIIATAQGFVSGSDTLAIIDNDAVTLTLDISLPSQGGLGGIYENGGKATATVTRNLVTDTPLQVQLSSSNTAAATVPATVIIPANQASATFEIQAIDNTILDGTKSVTITAKPTYTATNTALPTGNATANINIIDNESPSLKVVIDKDVISETGTATATITRNTNTSSNLIVTLNSSDTTEAIVPNTVTIAAGQTSATFTITGISDGINDGSQTVTITASATGLNSGSDSLEITDINVPDLVLTQLQGISPTYTTKQSQFTYTVTNNGIIAATGSWKDRVYLSTDNKLDTNDNLLGEFGLGSTENPANLLPGTSYNRTVTYFAPRNPGQYYLIGVTDNGNTVNEGLTIGESNNTTITPVTVTPAYRGTVYSDTETAIAGNPVTLRGQALSNSDNSPVAFEFVKVRVENKGNI
ncbi:MAG: Calx-beta domain-containing protein [Dolichospermum sp.]